MCECVGQGEREKKNTYTLTHIYTETERGQRKEGRMKD